MPSREQIEAALQEPQLLLQVIPDIPTFCGIADDNQYQRRLFACLFANPDFLLGLVKRATELDDIARRYPAYKEPLFQAVLTHPAFYRQLITNSRQLQQLVFFYCRDLRGTDSSEKGNQFLHEVIQRIILDEEMFLKVYHSPNPAKGDAIWRYDDQTLVSGTMRDFPALELVLWHAEVAHVIPRIYTELAETEDKRYLNILRDTIGDLATSHMFNQEIHDHFESHATACLERVSGDLKKELFYHLQFIANRKPLPSAEQLVASTQQSQLYNKPVPDDHAQSSSKLAPALPQVSVKGT